MTAGHLIKLGALSLGLLAVPAGIDQRVLPVDSTGTASGTVANPLITSTSGSGGSVTQGTTPWVVSASGNFGVTQQTSPWVVSGTVAATQSGTWTAQQGTPPWAIQGQQANGSAVTEQPVLIAGQNTGNVKLFGLDASGFPTVNQGTSNAAGTASWPIMGSVGATGAVVGNPLLMGGRDASGNSQFIGGNNSGVFAQGPVAVTAAAAGNPLRLGGKDGSGNMQDVSALAVIQGGFAYTSTQAVVTDAILHCTGQSGSTTSAVWAANNSADNQNSGAIGVVSNGYGYAYNGSGWDRQRNNTNASIRASGTVVTTQTVNTDITTYNAAAFMYHNNVTTYNGGTLTVSLQWKDANGQFVTIPGATTGGLTTGADIILAVGPSAWPANTATAFYVNYHIPRLIRVVEVVATASITMGGAYELTAN